MKREKVENPAQGTKNIHEEKIKTKSAKSCSCSKDRMGKGMT